MKQYQQVQLGGEDRVFPVQELIGAEAILARMHHEKVVSNHFTPVQLGEILQRRSFNAAGEVNPLQKSPKKATTLTMDDDHQLVQTEDPVWNPRSMLAVLDGITSVKWAMILVRWGDEKDVCTFCDFMTQKARSRPQKCEQFVSYWLACGWQLAMSMRSGTTFKEATSAIMRDLDRFNEHMAKDIPVDRKKPPVQDVLPLGKGKNSKACRTRVRDTPFLLVIVGNPTLLGTNGTNRAAGTKAPPTTRHHGGRDSPINSILKCKMAALGTKLANRDSTGPRVMTPNLWHPTKR